MKLSFGLYALLLFLIPISFELQYYHIVLKKYSFGSIFFPLNVQIVGYGLLVSSDWMRSIITYKNKDEDASLYFLDTLYFAEILVFTIIQCLLYTFYYMNLNHQDGLVEEQQIYEKNVICKPLIFHLWSILLIFLFIFPSTIILMHLLSKDEYYYLITIFKIYGYIALIYGYYIQIKEVYKNEENNNLNIISISLLAIINIFAVVLLGLHKHFFIIMDLMCLIFCQISLITSLCVVYINGQINEIQ